MTEYGETEALPAIDRVRRSGANIVVTLGNPPLDCLMGKRMPITKWRGSPLWSNRVGRKLIPTIHPAATLHGVYIWRYLILNDFGKVKVECETSQLNLPDRHYLIDPTFDEVMTFIEDCRKRGRVCTDIECMNHYVSCFSMAYEPDEAIVVPMYDEKNNNYWTEEEEAQIWLAYARLLEDRTVMKINHNIVGFDAVFLTMQHNIHIEGPIGDTMIAQSILYPDFRMGLDMTASMHTMEPYWKDDGKIWKANHGISYRQFLRYCGTDAAATLECWDVLRQELLDKGYMKTYDMTVALRKPLAYMTIRGLKIDRDGLEKAKINIDKKLEEKYAALAEVSDYIFSPTSPQQCAKYFYDHLGHKPYLNAAGGVSTNDKSLSRLVRKGEKGSMEAKLCQEIRGLSKLKGTYLEVELDRDDRLRCSWNPRGTVFGRLSSSKTIMGTGMNLQNLHPEFKGFIVAG
jgi:DNA polymerase I-like protein with 3'-5' exonuclease and polymerase domains